MNRIYTLSTQQIKEVAEELSKNLITDVENRFGVKSGEDLEDFEYVQRLWTTMISGYIRSAGK